MAAACEDARGIAVGVQFFKAEVAVVDVELIAVRSQNPHLTRKSFRFIWLATSNTLNLVIEELCERQRT